MTQITKYGDNADLLLEIEENMNEMNYINECMIDMNSLIYQIELKKAKIDENQFDEMKARTKQLESKYFQLAQKHSLLNDQLVI